MGGRGFREPISSDQDSGGERCYFHAGNYYLIFAEVGFELPSRVPGREWVLCHPLGGRPIRRSPLLSRHCSTIQPYEMVMIFKLPIMACIVNIITGSLRAH